MSILVKALYSYVNYFGDYVCGNIVAKVKDKSLVFIDNLGSTIISEIGVRTGNDLRIPVEVKSAFESEFQETEDVDWDTLMCLIVMSAKKLSSHVTVADYHAIVHKDVLTGCAWLCMDDTSKVFVNPFEHTVRSNTVGLRYSLVQLRMNKFIWETLCIGEMWNKVVDGLHIGEAQFMSSFDDDRLLVKGSSAGDVSADITGLAVLAIKDAECCNELFKLLRVEQDAEVIDSVEPFVQNVHALHKRTTDHNSSYSITATYAAVVMKNKNSHKAFVVNKRERWVLFCNTSNEDLRMLIVAITTKLASLGVVVKTIEERMSDYLISHANVRPATEILRIIDLYDSETARVVRAIFEQFLDDCK